MVNLSIGWILLILICMTIIITFYYYKLDKYDPEPAINLLIAFILGMISTVISVLGHLLFLISLSRIFNYDLDNFATFVIIIPIFEEFAKALMLIIVSKRIKFDGPLDGFIYGIMIGSGFAIIENLYFGLNEYWNSGLLAASRLSIIRGSITFIGHPLYTGLIGLSFGLLKVKYIRDRSKYIVQAVLMHISWNFVFYQPGLISYNFMLFLLFGLAVIGYSFIVVNQSIKLAIKIDEELFKAGYYNTKRKYTAYRFKK